eukprot:TRINITY_DN8574_c0_g1_i1.p1 TRINITY_DN8574_c0_g1~~TRINITY_DN8574_c0_g1_i1.p1  ORF type:complete len:860 (+),score=247.54 TRINITY_DN8574_c0_g1_i1:63-2582(+)
MQSNGKKAFVSHIDTHLGKVLCKKLSDAEFEVVGTSSEYDGKSTQDAKVVQMEDSVVLRKSVLDADVVVYQLEDSIEHATSILKILMNGQYDTEKTFVLVSSTATWFETHTAEQAEKEAAEEDEEEEPAEEEDDPTVPTYSEEEYTKRVPHIKYQLWKEVEKLCKKASSLTLHTYCIFGGLQYGLGEDKLHPIFKQAWHLAPQGLPVFGNSKNIVPTVHVADLATLAFKLATLDAPTDQRYFFGTDEGNNSWKSIIAAVNEQMGNGRSFPVPEHDYVLYENVEHFTINLKLEMGKMAEILEDDDWTARTGFVDNITKVINEFKKERKVEPLRVTVMGPPGSGKSYFSRELSSHYKVPAFGVYDVIKDYTSQLQEFETELQRLQIAKKEAKLREQLADLRAKKKEEALAAGERDEDEEKNDDQEASDELDKLEGEDEDEIFDDELLAELEKNKENDDEAGGEEEEDNEEMTAVKEQMEQVKKVLALREKNTKDDDTEPAHPKDKKKQDPKAKQPPKKEDTQEEPSPDARFSDRCLAYMVQWKLKQPQCRNQGFILDGFPKTVRQARYLFEEGLPGDLPADPDEEEEPLPEELKPMEDSIYPDFILQLKATDTFLTERIQKIITHHPHNNPADFQRRLELFKVNNPPRERAEPSRDASKGLLAFMDAALTNAESQREAAFRQFDVEGCPLVPPPPPASVYEKRPTDKVLDLIVDFIGVPRNYGPSPASIAEEQERVEKLAQEHKEQKEEEEEKRRKSAQQEKLEQEAVTASERERITQVKAQERAMLEARKEPLKQYLMTNVIPVLTKGIIEVCEQRPEDPIDYLADWLFRHNPVDDDTGI